MESRTYVVGRITTEAEKYGLATAHCQSADGVAGWIKLTGPGVEKLQVHDRITVTAAKADPAGTALPHPEGQPHGESEKTD